MRESSTKLYWHERGAGAPVVLLHGQLTTHVDWPDALLDDLASDHRVIVFDRPGYGRSAGIRHRQDVRSQADQIAQALAEAGVERPLLVGHSFGGTVALAYATRHPVRALVALAPLCFPEARLEHAWLAPRALPVIGPLISGLAQAPSVAMLRLAQMAMFAPQLPPPNWLQRYPYWDILNPAHLVLEGEESASMHPLSPRAYLNYARIDCPVRILLGQFDCIARNEWQGLILSRLLRDAPALVVPGAGHMLQHVATRAVYDTIIAAEAAAPMACPNG